VEVLVYQEVAVHLVLEEAHYQHLVEVVQVCQVEVLVFLEEVGLILLVSAAHYQHLVEEVLVCLEEVDLIFLDLVVEALLYQEVVVRLVLEEAHLILEEVLKQRVNKTIVTISI
jgi:hypothetical protein